MTRFQTMRESMVRHQLMARGIVDRRVVEAFRRVPRESFVPPESADLAYADQALPIACGQTISQPYIVALMTQALELDGDERVLEIGTGCGYQTAILAELAKEVYTIERHAALSQKARERLEQLGYGNVHFRVGDGTKGWPEEAPFDRIIITAAADRCPAALWEQLVPGGRLVAPFGDAWSQRLLACRKESDGSRSDEYLCACRFVPLISQDDGGGSEEAFS